MESQRRDIFTRYIPDVAAALSSLTGASEDRLLRDLQAVAKRRTAEADTVLDENGKPVAAAAETDELTGDESIVVVPENEAAVVSDDLFGENGNDNQRPRRRKRNP
jgi:hypothetical protein